MKFKDIIKNLRQEKKWSQQTLADELGVSKSTISAWENEYNFPNQEMQEKICKLFGCSLDYLMGRVQNRDGMIINEKYNSIDVTLEHSKIKYPHGLTHQQVLEILEGMDKLHMLDMFKKNK